MELNGEVLMNAPRERVWAALNDAAVLQACIPGCEEVLDDSPTQRRVRVMVKVGPVRARFNGKVTLSEVTAPERCVMGFEGSGGAAGMASGRSQVELLVQGEDTRMTYTVKASVGGKLGQIGGRLMDASAKQLADQFFDNLRARLAPPVTADAALPAALDAAPAPVPAASALPASTPTPPTAPAALAALAAPAAPAAFAAPAASRSDGGDLARALWFVLGAATMAAGVWLGAHLF